MIDGGYRVTSTDEGEGAFLGGFGDGTGDAPGAALEFLHFEDPHGTVPQDRLRTVDDVGELLTGVLPDVESHPAIWDGIAGGRRVAGVGGEFIGDDAIGGQVDADAFLLGLGAELAGGLKTIVLTEGVADLSAEGLKEGVSHPSTDDDIGGAFEKIFDDKDLIGDLGAADDGDKGFLRLVQDFFGAEYLAFHQQAEHPLVLGEELSDDGGGCVGAVGGAKGVVDIDVAEFSQFFGEGLVTFFLFLMKPQIFEKEDVPGLQRSGGFCRGLTDTVGGEGDGCAEELLEARNKVFEGIFFGGSILGTAEVGHQDDAAAVVKDLLYGRDGGADAGVVGDLVLVVKRNVEVDPDEGLFICKAVLAELAHIVILMQNPVQGTGFCLVR